MDRQKPIGKQKLNGILMKKNFEEQKKKKKVGIKNEFLIVGFKLPTCDANECHTILIGGQSTSVGRR